MKYFPNNSGYDCFRSSLCNLLLEENEIKLAKQVYSSFSDHRLINIKDHSLGVGMGITTKLIRDLTNQKYSAKLAIIGDEYDLEHSVFNSYPEEIGRKYSKVINQEFNKGNIIFVPQVTPINENYIKLRETSESLSHFIVQRNDGKQINDGFIEQVPVSEKLVSVIQIYKK